MRRDVPFPFVVGSMRSGTTLLMSMLDSHPELAIPGESYFIADLAKRYAGGGYSIDRYLRDLDGSGWFHRWGLPHAEVASVVRTEAPSSFPDAVRLTYAAFAAHAGKPRYGDKTPIYVTKLRVLGDLFPEARFVHLLRDGRDVANALRSASFGPSSLAAAAIRWERHVQHGRTAGPALGDRYLEVSYESLVADPEPTLRRICEHFGLDFVPDMLERRGSPGRYARTPNQGDHRSLLLPVTKGLRDWRRDLDGQDQALLQALIGPTLAAAGYEPAAVEVTQEDTRRAAKARSRAGLARRKQRVKRALITVRRRVRGS